MGDGIMFISAIPLKRGPLYDYRNKHLVNTDKIKVVLYNDQVSPNSVNVILEDNTEWVVAREAFESMFDVFYKTPEKE
jgi:hypothetical protein